LSLLFFAAFNLEFDLLQFAIVAVDDPIKDKQSNGIRFVLRTLRHSKPSYTDDESVMIMTVVIVIMAIM